MTPFTTPQIEHTVTITQVKIIKINGLHWLLLARTQLWCAGHTLSKKIRFVSVQGPDAQIRPEILNYPVMLQRLWPERPHHPVALQRQPLPQLRAERPHH